MGLYYKISLASVEFQERKDYLAVISREQSIFLLFAYYIFKKLNCSVTWEHRNEIMDTKTDNLEGINGTLTPVHVVICRDRLHLLKSSLK